MTASAEQEVQDEPEDLRLEKKASERLLIFDLAHAISHEDMRARYAAISDRPKNLTTRPRQ
jgi:antitoxin StbD